MQFFPPCFLPELQAVAAKFATCRFYKATGRVVRNDRSLCERVWIEGSGI